MGDIWVSSVLYLFNILWESQGLHALIETKKVGNHLFIFKLIHIFLQSKKPCDSGVVVVQMNYCVCTQTHSICRCFVSMCVNVYHTAKRRDKVLSICSCFPSLTWSLWPPQLHSQQLRPEWPSHLWPHPGRASSPGSRTHESHRVQHMGGGMISSKID